jgi:hypothetical protein
MSKPRPRSRVKKLEHSGLQEEIAKTSGYGAEYLAEYRENIY